MLSYVAPGGRKSRSAGGARHAIRLEVHENLNM
jgi:hypothetical protein